MYILHVKNRFVLCSTRRPAVCYGALQYVCANRTPEPETLSPTRDCVSSPLVLKDSLPNTPCPPPSHTNNRHPAHHLARTSLPPTTQHHSTLPSRSSIPAVPLRTTSCTPGGRVHTSDGHVPLVQRAGLLGGQLLRRWASLLG